MNELVGRKNNDVIDVSFVSYSKDRIHVFNTGPKSKLGKTIKNYANPVAALDARDKPGYVNKNAIREPESKMYDFAPPLKVLKRNKKSKRVFIFNILLSALTVLFGLLFKMAPSILTLGFLITVITMLIINNTVIRKTTSRI